jgi:hypothetical protein
MAFNSLVQPRFSIMNSPSYAERWGRGTAEASSRLAVGLLGPLRPQLQFGRLVREVDPPPSPGRPFPIRRRRPERSPAPQSTLRASVVTAPAEAKEHARRRQFRPTSPPNGVRRYLRRLA